MVAAQLRHLTPSTAEVHLNAGVIDQYQYEAFMHVWATSAPRFSEFAQQWKKEPTNPVVIGIVAEMRSETKP